MKTISLFKVLLTLAAVLGFFAVATPATAEPHPGVWDARHHYYRDNYGYWNDHDRYQHYVYWHTHHGYWDDRGGTRVFINVD